MINCPICHQPAELLLNEVKDYFILKGDSPDFQIFYCASCQIAQSQPYLSDGELASYYPKEYEAYVPKKSFAGFLQILKYQSDLKLINQRLNKASIKIFEIGAGRGEFLAQAKKIGFKIDGIEPGRAGREAAQKFFDVNLKSGYAEKMYFTDKYDVIVLRHVFEHLNEPLEVLSKIKNGLAEGGILFLKLPRLDSWEAKVFKKYWHGYDLPRHRFHYTKNGIINLLKLNSFSQIKVISEQVPTDFIRSIKYYQAGENNLLSKLFKLFLILPDFMQLVLAQLLVVAVSPLVSGRMIVIAKFIR